MNFNLNFVKQQQNEAFLSSYLPIIEIDFRDPAGQLIDLRNNLESHLPLIEKNFQEVQNSHTWSMRTEKILEIIRNDFAE
jgi:hypothetical protein